MNMFGLINIGVLPLLLEAMTPAYAQHEREPRQPKQDHQSEQGRPAREARPAPGAERIQDRGAQPRPRGWDESHPQQRPPTGREHPAQDREARTQTRPSPRQAPARRSAGPVQRQREANHQTVWQAHRAGNWQAEHRTWQDRGGYQGYRIPEARYRRHFGSSFGFRMFSFPLVVVGGFPRFQYEGFWFSVIDPWPEYWSIDWYGEDDLYIEYSGDGYYLHNRSHPMDRIAISVQIR